MSKIQCDLGQLLSLTVNISGTQRDIHKQSTALSRAIHPALKTKKTCELWSTKKRVIDVHVDPPYVDIACFAYANTLQLGPCDFATREISQL